MGYPSFGQAIPVLGPLSGFPGNVSRMGSKRAIVSRPVLPTTATNLPFGAGAVEISNTTNGNWQSLFDFLTGAPANAALVQQQFGGIAVRNIKTQTQYLSLNQSTGTSYTTTATQATVGSTTIVVASAANLAVGQAVEGVGIAPNTLVTGVSGTTITISLATVAVMSTTTVVFTSSSASVVGNYAPNTEADVLLEGSISAVVAYGAPQNNYPVYIRALANSALGGTALGDFEAADDVATTTPTTTTTIGSATLTTSTGTGVAIGQRVTAPGIPANTYITAGSGTTWTMSNLATGTTSTQAASFSNMILLGSLVAPWLVFRTGQLDSNLIGEITIKNRHAA